MLYFLNFYIYLELAIPSALHVMFFYSVCTLPLSGKLIEYGFFFPNRSFILFSCIDRYR